MQSFSRREFLACGAASMALFTLPRVQLDDLLPGAKPPPAPLGRLTSWWRQAVRTLPSGDADVVSWKQRDDVIPLYAAVAGNAPWPTNPIWYLTTGGYIHSGYVQPVKDAPQSEVIAEVEPPGFWAEVCVPIAEARWRPNSPYVAHRLYHGTVYRVARAVEDEEGGWWYQLHEGVTWSPGPYVPSSSVRRIRPEELTPISPGEPDKWVRISIPEQKLTCFEGERTVFRTPMSSGVYGTGTPLGEFRVVIQRHTRRMIGGTGSGRYDLPGVAFPVYITFTSIAIHGTYWHNDYGRRHSAGCINLTNEAARWFFRWVEPHVPYPEYTVRSPGTEGTRVVVV